MVYERVYDVCVYTERVVRFRSNDSSSNGEVGRSQVGLECTVLVRLGRLPSWRAGSVGERNGSTTGSVCLE